MVLSSTQRAKILADIAEIASNLSLTVLDERQKIENIDDFPLVQTTFLSEGRRQAYWATMLHEYQYATSHEWNTYYGHISQATVSVSIRSLDVDELKTKAYAFHSALWQTGVNWRMESASRIEWRGCEAPKFLPAYLDVVERRHDIYSCVIDFFVDYEFSWSQTDPPILTVSLTTDAGNVDNEDYGDEIELIANADGSYVMVSTIHGPPVAYQMDTIIIEV